jgi:hypothetical protein
MGTPKDIKSQDINIQDIKIQDISKECKKKKQQTK